MKEIIYRKDIDGLRAVAVISVVLFHAGIDGFSGGYVGVDVFYVISGYLISKIIYREINRGEFRFRKFWLRRARRILPASIFLVFLLIPIFLFLYPTNFYKDFIGSIIANQFFVSNILFWNQGGYFASTTELKPLLHTWSLSIEEQFYIGFPVFLLLIVRFFKSYIIFVVCLALISSLLLSVYASKYHSYAAFYLIPTRAWELGLGGLIALLGEKHLFKIRYSKFSQWIGISMIFGSIVFFDKNTPFPSYYAAVPVFGAGMIILSSNTKSIITKILSSSVMVWVGLISYSVYLWHWPVMVLKRWIFPYADSIALSIGAILFSFGLGYLSYRFIEIPTRNRKLVSDKNLVKGVIGSSILILLISLLLLKIGNGALVDPAGVYVSQYQKARMPEQSRENCTNVFRDGESRVCGNVESDEKNVDLFIWGDSHAGAMIPAFYALSSKHNINFQYSVTLGCQPVLGMHRVDLYHSCPEVHQKVIDLIVAKKYSSVILIGSFVNNTITGKLRDISGVSDADLNTRLLEFSRRFNQTVEVLKKAGSKVYVLTEPPRFQVKPPLEILRSSVLGVPPEIPELSLDDHLKRIHPVYKLIDRSGVDKRLDYTEFFCPNGKCSYKTDDGNIMYKDRSHISNFSAESLVDYLALDLNL